jgi:hypothetical protein
MSIWRGSVVRDAMSFFIVLPQDNRLNGSPTNGSLRSSDWKSSWKMSIFADELNNISTAPAARNGVPGVNDLALSLLLVLDKANRIYIFWFWTKRKKKL